MIHVKTQKGKGYSYAEKASDHYHGVSKFNVTNWRASKKWNKFTFLYKSFCKYFSKTCQRDSKIVGVTAAMPGGTGLWIFLQKNFLKECLM